MLRLILRLWSVIDIPPLWLGGAMGAAWLMGEVAPLRWLGRMGDRLGTLLILAGLALAGVAAVQMVLRHTSFIPRRDPSALVTGGAFRISRNPIYLGDALILAGASLHWDALLALPLVPAFAALISRRFIAGEEAMIAAHFGQAWDDFAARTRRWL